MNGSSILIAGAAIIVVAVVVAIAATIAKMPADAAPSQTLSPDPDAAPLSPDPEYDEAPEPFLWKRLTSGDDGPLGVSDRLDMVSRLEMVGEKWCTDALHAAIDEDADPQVQAAARAALARVAASP